MKNGIRLLAALFFCALAQGAAAGGKGSYKIGLSFPGSKDHPEIPRMAGSDILGYDFAEFNELDLALSGLGRKEKAPSNVKTVEGRVTRILYL